MTPFDSQTYDPSILDLDSDAYSNNVNQDSGNNSPHNEDDKNTTQKQPAKKTGNSKKETKKIVTPKEDADNGPSLWVKIADFFCDRRTHGAVGLLMIGFAAYVLISSLSFFVSGIKDQSATSAANIEQLAQQPGSIENLGGPAGAVMSQVILTNSFGIGALVMTFYMIVIGLALLRVVSIKFWSFTFKSLLIALTLSMVAGLVTYNMETYFLWGGQHGRLMNMLLMQRFGVTGAIVVSAVLVGLIVIIYLNELIALYKMYRAKMNSIKEKREKDRAEREKIEEEVKANTTDEIVTDEDDPQSTSADSSSENQAENVVFNPADEKTDDSTSLINPMEQEEVAEKPDKPLPSEGKENELLENISKLSPKADDIPLEVIHNKIEQAESINTPFDPTAELSHFKFPPLELLIDHPTNANQNVVQDEDKERIIRSLREYGININKIDATVGPTVTLFEIVPEEGTRIQQIKRLEDDLMRSLSAIGIRIVAPIPGKGTIGIEVPNKNPQTVGIRAVLSSKKYQEFKGELPMAMGATISNEVYVADLAKMPHLLVAGATGQGKSVGLNTIIASLIYKKHPSTLKFVLIDPKMVEFSLYSKLEHHYLAKMPDEEEPIITSSDRVLSTLNSLCVEMDNRYMLLKSAGVRNIKEYNEKFIGRHLNPEKGHNFMPYIVVIIDEFADLITVLGKEVETPVARITAKARAVGIHMIIATQRPSIDVITGVIKNNIPGRIAFKVPQSTDSKTILDRTGANQLIGRGDMLFLNGSNLDRVQCAFIDTPEVEAICEFIENEQGYPTSYLLPDYNPNAGNEGNAGAVTERDPMFAACATFTVQSGTASTSSLQRRYSIGYNRAGKIMDQMEAAGIVGPAMGSKPRQVLMDITALDHLLTDMGLSLE